MDTKNDSLVGGTRMVAFFFENERFVLKAKPTNQLEALFTPEPELKEQEDAINWVLLKVGGKPRSQGKREHGRRLLSTKCIKNRCKKLFALDEKSYFR